MSPANDSQRDETLRLWEKSVSNGHEKFERWIRLPKRGHEENSGLSRPMIYGLIKAGLVKSASIKQPGKLTGCRLVWLPSLMEYVERHVEKVG